MRGLSLGLLALLSGTASASPVVFEENAGQHDARAKLVARAQGAAVFLTDDGAVFSLQRGRARIGFRLELAGAHAVPEAFEPLAERRHYFKGTPEHWRTNVRTFARARYRSAWPGIDVELHGETGALELDLRVAPHADVEAARLAFTGATVRAVHPDSLELDVAGERVKLGAPSARQGAQVVECHYRRRGAQIGFELGPRDDTREVLIDPVVETWSGYAGGSDDDAANSVAVAANGDAVIAGDSSSADFPAMLGARMYAAGQDGFVTRLDPLTGAVAWQTFIGGAADDGAAGVAIEPGGEIDVVGTTLSANFPSTVPSRSYDGGPNSDAYLVRLPPSGDALLFASTLGGTNLDLGTAVAADATSIWVAGNTRSNAFSGGTPTPMLNYQSNQDGFVAQLQRDAGMTFFTWFGGEAVDSINALQLDSAGNVYLVGSTSSRTAFPLLHPLLDAGSGADGFAAIIDTNAPASVTFSTLIGGPSNDALNSVALLPGGDFYVGGYTFNSVAWLPASTKLHARTAGQDGIVARIGALGSSLEWVGIIGGGDVDAINGVAADARGNLCFAGYVGPGALKGVTPGAIQSTGPAKSNGVFGLVDAEGNQFVYLSFLGGASSDSLHDLALLDGGMVLVGESQSADFPTAGAPTSLHGDGGTTDAVVTTVFIPAPSVAMLVPAVGPIDGGTRVDFTGDFFLPDASVTFAGNGATVVQTLGQTGLSVLTPPGLPGPADVVVTNADGQTTRLAGAFTYTGSLAPVASISPPSQSAQPGTTVTFDGSASTGVAPLTFAWEQSAGPTAGDLTPSGAMAQFSAQAVGDYAIKLTVTDGNGVTANAIAALTMTGSAPPVPPFKPGCGCSTFDLSWLIILLPWEKVARGRKRARPKSTR